MMRLKGMIRKQTKTSSKLLAYLKGLLLVIQVLVLVMERTTTARQRQRWSGGINWAVRATNICL
jgi:hypothetical protein